MAEKGKALVGIIMGSDTDLPVMKEAAATLDKFGVPFEIDITSAHRSPARTAEYARTARERGLKAIIVGAGGAAHLAGVVAAESTLPVIGVPMPTMALNGMDSLLSIVQMPKGIPVATMAIGKGGAANAGLFAAAIIAVEDHALAERIAKWRAARAEEVLKTKLP